MRKLSNPELEEAAATLFSTLDLLEHAAAYLEWAGDTLAHLSGPGEAAVKVAFAKWEGEAGDLVARLSELQEAVLGAWGILRLAYWEIQPEP